jgi:hypothetical protein
MPKSRKVQYALLIWDEKRDISRFCEGAKLIGGRVKMNSKKKGTRYANAGYSNDWLDEVLGGRCRFCLAAEILIRTKATS